MKLKWMQDELDRLAAKAQLRHLTASIPADTPGWIMRNGRKMLNLASNDYLGLAAESTRETNQTGNSVQAESAPSGAGASRLIVGTDEAVRELEEDFAAFKGTEACLLFGSGYMANVGTIPALVGRHDVVFSDRLNHASIVDGIKLSRARHMRYRHRDLDHLETLLRQAPPRARKLIITDSVFSMDGSMAPLKELVELKERYGAMLMVDEAHSGGIFGPDGRGLAHQLGLSGRIDIQMGTFSKAYGCYGAYVAGSNLLIQYLINTARSFIYSTALPQMLIALIRRNWQKAVTESWRRRALLERSAAFRQTLRQAGFELGASECQIVPVWIGDNEQTVRFSERLQEAGIAAVAVRPPTVPEGTARIRFTMMAIHEQSVLEEAAETLIGIGRQMRLIDG